MHSMTSAGHVVVNIDNRGSYNRGINFEAHLQNKMVFVCMCLHVSVCERECECVCISLSVLVSVYVSHSVCMRVCMCQSAWVYQVCLYMC